MKKKTKKRAKAVNSNDFHHCHYCGKRTPIGVETCYTCARKRDLVHELWMIGQMILADARRNQTDEIIENED